MPRTSKIPTLEKQVADLKKELALAEGRNRDNSAKIEHLEKRLASATEQVAAADEKLQSMGICEIANKNLQKRCLDLEEGLEHERKAKEELRKECLQALQGNSREITLLKAEYFNHNRVLGRMQEQNIALRKALKEVL